MCTCGLLEKRVHLARHAPELPEHLHSQLVDASLRRSLHAALRVQLREREVVDLRVWGLEFGVWGLECGVWGVECGVWGVGCGVRGVGCGGWGLGVGDRAIDARRDALELIHLRFRVPPEGERD